jgi:hypothetical protein
MCGTIKNETQMTFTVEREVTNRVGRVERIVRRLRDKIVCMLQTLGTDPNGISRLW